MNDKRSYSPEVRERAIRMVREQRDHFNSEWAAIRSIAEKFGCKAETLRLWIRRDECDSGQRPGPTTEDSEELKRLKRENFELKRANEILRKAQVFNIKGRSYRLRDLEQTLGARQN